MPIRPNLLTTLSLQVSSILLLAIAPSPALSETCADPIDTNRPSFMNSPQIVPPLGLQLENGTEFQGFRGHKSSYDIPETEVRLGIVPSTEFQMFVPNYFLLHSQGDNTAYASDITDLGIKTHIGKENAKFNVAVIAAMILPTGSSVISGSGVEPVVRVSWGYAINRNWAFMGQQSILVLNKGHDVQWQPDFMLSRTLGSKASAFIEYESILTHGAFPQNLIHFGATYKITRNQQIDTHFGFGLNKAAPSAFIGVGYSFRFCSIR